MACIASFDKIVLGIPSRKYISNRMQQVKAYPLLNIFRYRTKEIYPSLYFYYIFKNLGKKYNLKLTYQIIQKEKGILIFNIKERLTDKQKKQLKEEIENYFANDMTYSIHGAVNEKVSGGKTKSFISYI